MGHAGKGICGSRHDRRTVSTRQKRKSKFVTCAERPPRHLQRTKAPAKKKKQVCDVCGAPTSSPPENKSTRPKRKSKFVTCAERPPSKRQRTKVHAKKEKASLRRVRSTHLVTSREQKYTPKKKKQVCDVCGAPSKQTSENKSTCLKKFPQSEGISI